MRNCCDPVSVKASERYRDRPGVLTGQGADDRRENRREVLNNMSTNDDATTEHSPLKDAGNEDLAGRLEDQKQEARAAVDGLTLALLNDDEPLTDERVQEVASAAGSLMALSRALIHRVPEEHRTGDEWAR